MKTILRFVLLLLGLILLLTGLAIYMLNNPAFLSKLLQTQLADSRGWQLEMDGVPELQWGNNSLIEVQGLRLLNPGWPGQKLMFSASSLRLEWQPWQLLRRRLVMDELRLSDCNVYYTENEAGTSNWTSQPKGFEEKGAETDQASFGWSLQQAQLTSCEISVKRAGHEQPLNIFMAQAELQLDQKTNLRAQIIGSLDQHELSLDGYVRPWSALWQGGSLQHEIELQAGEVHLHSSGSAKDFLRGKGANLQLRFSGPELRLVTDWLALPNFSSGAFDAQLKIIDPENQGRMQVSIAADLGSLEIQGQGELDSWVAPDEGRMELQIQGPDLGALARTVGQEWVVERPFAIELKADIAQSQTRLDQFSLTMGADRMTASGQLGPWHALSGSALDIKLNSADLTPWLEASGSEMPLGKAGLKLPLSLSADLARSGEGLDFRITDGNLATLKFGMSGRMPDVQKPSTLSANFDLSMPSLRMARDQLPLPELPDLPLAANGEMRLDGSRHAILEGVALVLGQSQIRLDADLQLRQGLLGSSAKWAMQGADLRELLPTLGQQLNSGPFSLDGEWQREPEGHVLKALEFRSESLSLAASGNVTDWTGGGNFELSVEANSPDVSRHMDWVEPFLDSQPMSLKFSLSGTPANFRTKDIILSQGKNRLAGDLAFLMNERPIVSGKIHSEVLDLVPAERHWAALQQKKQQQSPAVANAQNKRLFSGQAIKLFGDLALDLSLDIQVDRLLLSSNEFRDVDLQLDLQEQSLLLNRFAFRGIQDGQYSGQLSSRKRGDQTELEFQARAEDLRLGQFGITGLDAATLPPADIEIDLAGIGQNWQGLAQSLTGKVRWYSSTGRISNSGLSLIFSDLLTQIFNTLNPLSKKSEYTQLQCAVYAADFLNGRMKLAPVVIQTDQITAFSEGEVDLATEQISLNFRTVAHKGLGISAGSVVNPFFKIGGTLLNPALQLDVTRGAISGGAMVATAGLSVLFKSVSDRLLVSSNPCADARATIESRDIGSRVDKKG